MSLTIGQGQTVTITVTWLAGGPATDVSGLTIQIVNSATSDEIVAPTAVGIVHLSTGVYTYAWTPAADLPVGDHTAIWAATALPVQTETITVTAGYGFLYVERDMIKDVMNITTTDKDDQIDRAIAASGRAIERRCGRVFYRDEVASTRTFDSTGRVVRTPSGSILLVDDIATAEGFDPPNPGAVLWPPSSFVKGQPATGLLAGNWAHGVLYDVAARWGYPSVPEDITMAVQLQTTRLVRRPGSPEGVAGSAEWGLVRIPNLDPDVRALCDPFRLPGIG